MAEKHIVPLGAKVRDVVTGFTGTVTGRAEYLYAEPSVAVEALVDGKPKTEWFHENRIVPTE